MKYSNNNFVFKEKNGELEFIGDFNSLYKNIDDPWYQSCQTEEPIKYYYKFSRDRLITQLKNINPKPNIYLGGPVDVNKGFVIHENGYETNGTLEVSRNISLTSNLKIINDIIDGNGPHKFRFALGYSGWGPGQLEDELKQGDWLVLPAEKNLIFNTPDNMMWKKACKKLGIDLDNLGGQAGIS